ncbi:hypothetical protein SOM38_18115 [Pantoea agglomerans]|uniref:hypothetical protein n=1 Tax=Enterobacter agglomerans TaxID=549 RepID=UPI002A6A62AD|nr:hypothetical protein [Pantoea agglomerans]MDY0996026.1 hypothetical protein [Pantoea agglomerans]
MKILINNLSIDQMIIDYNKINTEDVFIDLARCLKVLRISNSPNDILLTGNFDSFLEIEIAKGKSFRTELKGCSDRDVRGLVLSRLSNYTKIEDLEQHKINYSLSLFVSDCWKEVNTILNESSDNLKSIKNIPCFYSGGLLKVINRANILIDMCSPVTKDIIDKKCAEIYYHPEIEKKYTELMRTNDSEKKQVISKITELTCIINGFKKEQTLSNKNRRDIYYNENKKAYLSVDFLHGTFEIHSQDGTHQYEINCKGEIIEAGDKSGKHNIEIK